MTHPTVATLAAWVATPRVDGTTRHGIRRLFEDDPARFHRYSRRAGPILMDFSKTSLDDEALNLLQQIAIESNVFGRRDAMIRGEPVNATENRAVLHMALRAKGGFKAGEEDASAEVALTLEAMQAFTANVHSGRLVGATGKPFTDVLNIGIGGSDLGPFMAVRALWSDGCPMRPHFLANVDAHAWEALRPRLNPETTLVLIASKTFTTAETLLNATMVRAWLREALGQEDVSAHFVALSTNIPATSAFGVPVGQVFGFRDWVGGRFSLWSAIGMVIALSCGWAALAGLQEGARAMDEHFLTAPAEDNLPLLLALVEVWHVNGLGYTARAVLPYDNRLGRLPAHLQQVEMESLGKRIHLDGYPVGHATGPVVFGEPGTNAQHSFMQLLHQGTTPVPVDFILIARPDHRWAENHRMLLANGLAQSEALLAGRTLEDVHTEMTEAGADAATIERVALHRVFPGDRPSVTLLLPHLDPVTLGALVALYEHKVFCLGALWQVNAFDQYGVELGKHLAAALLPEVASGAEPGHHDGSTAGLIAAIRGAWNG